MRLKWKWLLTLAWVAVSLGHQTLAWAEEVDPCTQEMLDLCAQVGELSGQPDPGPGIQNLLDPYYQQHFGGGDFDTACGNDVTLLLASLSSQPVAVALEALTNFCGKRFPPPPPIPIPPPLPQPQPLPAPDTGWTACAAAAAAAGWAAACQCGKQVVDKAGGLATGAAGGILNIIPEWYWQCMTGTYTGPT